MHNKNTSKLFIIFLFVFVLALVVSCKKTEEKQIPIYVVETVTQLDITKFPEAARQLKEHIDSCGQGVVIGYAPGEGKTAENKCSYQVDPYEVVGQKTGYIYKDNWDLEEGIQFAEVSEKELAETPEEWDFLQLGKAASVKINTQECGDCWSQATTKGLELLIAGHSSKLVDLSVQTQISGCSNHGSCSGGYMTAPDFLIKHGNPFENQDPYQGRNSSCKFSKSELDKGFEYKLKSAPYVGSSLEHSRYFLATNRNRSGAKVEQIKAMMYKYKSPAVVTIQAISHSGGIIKSCSAINSGGNHMQDIVGWYKDDGDEIARVWNSWGKSHGQNGITHLKWECGAGQLNRGLGRAARVYEGDLCDNYSDAYTGPNKMVLEGNAVKLGKKNDKQKCEWTPKEGLSDPNSCETYASPEISTEYHLKAKTECDEKSAMVLVTVYGPKIRNELLRTPFGVVKYDGLQAP